MPIFNESETLRHRTQQQAPMDQISSERVYPLSDHTHASPLCRKRRDTHTFDSRAGMRARA